MSDLTNTDQNISDAVEIYKTMRAATLEQGWEIFVQVIKSSTDQAIAAGYARSRADASQVCRERAAQCQSVLDAPLADGITKAQARYCVSAVTFCAAAIEQLSPAAAPGDETERVLLFDAEKWVIALRRQYIAYWRGRDEHYWMERLMQEVGELASSLALDHDDPPEVELKQIAAICINWLEMRAASVPGERPFGRD